MPGKRMSFQVARNVTQKVAALFLVMDYSTSNPITGIMKKASNV